MGSKKGATFQERLRAVIKECLMDFSLSTKLPSGCQIDRKSQEITAVLEKKVKSEGFLSLKEFESVTWTIKFGLRGDADMMGEILWALYEEEDSDNMGQETFKQM